MENGDSHLCKGKIKDSQLFVVDDISIPLELSVPDCVKGIGTGVSVLWLLRGVPHDLPLIIGPVDSHL